MMTKRLDQGGEFVFHLGTIQTRAFLSAAFQVLTEQGYLVYTFQEDRLCARLFQGEDISHLDVDFQLEGQSGVFYTSNAFDAEAFNHLHNSIEAFVINGEAALVEQYEVIAQRVAEMQAGKPSDSFEFHFQPFRKHIVTTVIIAINTLVFIAMLFGGADLVMPTSEIIVTWGGNFRPLVLQGDYWRLISNCFVHIGILHFVLNTYALYYIGLLLEQLIGWKKFLWLYLLCGWLASVTSLYFHVDSVSAGASGAIFGLYGVFLSMLVFKSVAHDIVKTFLTSILLFVGYNLLLGMRGGIDNAAHMGGLVSGFILGMGLVPATRSKLWTKFAPMAVVTISAILLSLSLLVMASIPKPNTALDEALHSLSVIEEEAMAMYRFPENTPNDSILHFVETVGLPSWNRGLELLNDVPDQELNAEQLEIRDMMIRYCDLRIRSYELIRYNLLQTNSDSMDKLGEINGEIKDLVQRMQE